MMEWQAPEKQRGEVFTAVGFNDLGLEPFSAEVLIPDRGRRIAGIPGSRPVILKKGVYADG